MINISTLLLLTVLQVWRRSVQKQKVVLSIQEKLDILELPTL